MGVKITNEMKANCINDISGIVRLALSHLKKANGLMGPTFKGDPTEYTVTGKQIFEMQQAAELISESMGKFVSAKQKADCWDDVCKLLDQISPEWKKPTGSRRDLALCAIRSMMDSDKKLHCDPINSANETIKNLLEAGDGLRNELAQWSLTERDKDTQLAMSKWDYVRIGAIK